MLPALGTVLCAVDTSDTAAAVIYTAAGLAAHESSQLIVLRVLDHLRSADTREAEERALLECTERAIPGWMSYREGTTFMVAAGDPAHVILEEAQHRGANLIVLGTHSRSALARALFGSVTARVLRETRVPVAVVPPEARELISLTDNRAVPHMGSIVVPVDLDGESARQLAFASVLSLASERELNLLHVIPPKADSAEPLARLQEMARSVDSHAGTRAIVTHGPVVKVIVDRQQKEHAGVVILGRDADSPGHVARELLQQTHAIVIFVP